jgi:hypothetical protein
MGWEKLDIGIYRRKPGEMFTSRDIQEIARNAASDGLKTAQIREGGGPSTLHMVGRLLEAIERETGVRLSGLQ